MTLFKNFNIPTITKAIQLIGKRSKLLITCILLFSAIDIAGTVLYAIGIKGVITAIGERNYSLFWQSLLLILLNYTMWWIYAPISSYLCSSASKGAIRDIKTKLCRHIISLPMKYHDKKAKGEILSAVSNDVACLQDIYDWYLFKVLNSALDGIGGIVIMAVIDWRFAIVVFVLGTVSVLTTSHFSKMLEKKGAELQDRLTQSSTDAYEFVKAAKTIRLMNLIGIKTESFSKRTKMESDTRIKIGKASSKMNAIILGISATTYIAILFIGALFVYFKLTDWGTIIALAGLKIITDMLFLEFGQFMAGMQTSVAGIKRLFAILNIPKETIVRDSSFAIDKINHPLAMNDISFSYDEDASVIRNFNMILENKNLTVLVGESGSGKSTIMKLILGLYEPNEGSIAFEGTESVTIENIRRKTAYVPQDAMLFRGSIYDNIAFGNENASKDEIIAAATLAGADEFTSELENGYETILLDDGNSLSGGQKQRIAIARALVKNAPILLLDEITSALDKRAEEHILETIKNISLTKAVLFITHRNNVMKWADRIYTVK